MGFTANEDRLRQEIAANPWFGSWDEWAAAHFNHLPVFARAALGHLYGKHDETELPVAHCVLCSTFRVHPDRAAVDANQLAAEAAAANYEERTR
jgi:hypothetical protein